MSWLIHAEAVARRKLGQLPDGWTFCIWEKVGTDAQLLRGGVPTLTRKGRKKWPAQKHLDVAVVTDAEVETERTHYEQTTGLCADCLGKREVFQSWSSAEGVKNMPCPRCSATGKRVLG